MKLNLVPSNRNMALQNYERNLVSRSLTITFGVPCKQTMRYTNSCANDSALMSLVHGTKWTIFDSLSTTVKIASNPAVVFGNWVIRSIVIYSHFELGASSGLSKPADFCVLVLLAWQLTHDLTYYSTSRWRPGHQKR